MAAIRVLALDIGEKRIGLAISDPGERVATPVCVLPHADVLGGAKTFRRILEDWEPEMLLCGMPLSLNGTEGPQAMRIRHDAESISRDTGLPVAYSDERMSSSAAKRSLREKGYTEREMRGKVDMIAACIFLQSWLDARASGCACDQDEDGCKAKE